MMEALWYLIGLFTIPALALLALLWEWLTDKNWEVECLRCNRYFGEIGETYVRITDSNSDGTASQVSANETLNDLQPLPP